MAKKNKRNLRQLAAKRQTLTALQQNQPTPSLPSTPQAPRIEKTQERVSLPQREPQAKALPQWHVHRELTRTLASIVIIALVLTGIVVVNNRQSFLDNLGDRLYHSLQLDQ